MNTKPLSEHAVSLLKEMLVRPVPLNEINAGVSNKFRNEGLARIIEYSSPYAKHRGGTCPHMSITEKGREIVCKQKPR